MFTYIKKPVSNKWLDPALCMQKKWIVVHIQTSPRWYEPDQVPRVKKLLARFSLSPTYWTPLVMLIKFIIII